MSKSKMVSSLYWITLMGANLLLAGCSNWTLPSWARVSLFDSPESVQLAKPMAPTVVSPPPVKKPQYDAKPFLRLEIGMHTARINHIAVDKQERFLVTASDDKTARVWDLASGDLLQTLRPPIGEGSEGKLYAAAISPEGDEVAVGGYTGKEGSPDIYIYFFERASGRLTRHVNVATIAAITHVKYSTDGRYLAAALSGKNGVRVYDTVTLQEAFRDGAYAADSYGLDFDRQGRLACSSYDGYIRLYDNHFRLIAKKNATGGKQPFGVAFAPDGGKIAVGFNDVAAVNVLSGENLNFLYSPDAQGLERGNLVAVSWSLDGENLYAGGRYAISGGDSPLLGWRRAGSGERRQLPLGNNTIMDLAALSGERVVFGSGDPGWGVANAGGKLSPYVNAGKFDFRGGALALDAAGGVVEAADILSVRQSLRFDAARQEFLSANAKPGLAKPKTQAPGLKLSDWEGGGSPILNGKTLLLDTNERARSLSVAADGKHFLLGASGSLRYYDRDGRLLWRTPLSAAAWQANESRDGRLAVAALGDGSIRWYLTRNGKEQLALFAHPDGRRWILWTPDGFYSASPEAEDWVGYQLNQRPNKEGKFVSLRQLRQWFYRPDLIARRLQGDEQGLEQALAEIGGVEQALQRRLAAGD